MGRKFCFIAIAFFWYFAVAWPQNTIHRQADIGGAYGVNYANINCLPTSDGGFIAILGSTSGTTGTFATTPITPTPTFGTNWIVLVKYDINGNMQWQKAFGGDDGNSSHESNFGNIIKTNDHGWLIAGSSNEIPPVGNKTAPAYGYIDTWVIKLDSAFNIQWQNSYGGSGSEQFYKAQQNSDGTYYFAGVSSSSVSGTKTDSCRGNGDFWLVKTDAMGNQLWDKTVGSPDSDNLVDFTVVNDRIFLLGKLDASDGYHTYSSGECSMGYGNIDIWITALDTSGNLLWDKTFGGNGNDVPNAICYNNHRLYIVGSSDSTSLTPPTTRTAPAKSYIDAWLIQLDTNGVQYWEKSYGGTPSAFQYMSDIEHIPNTSNLLMAGSSDSNAANDKSENSRGLTDYWLLKIDTAGNVLWDKTIGGSDDDLISQKALYVVDSNTFFVGGVSNSTISGDKTVPIYSTTYGDFWCLEWGPADLGIKQYAVSDFLIYPNPATDIITIRGEQLAEIQEINIMDLSGKVVKHQKVKNKNQLLQFDVKDLTQGTYFIRLTGKTITSTYKLVKE
jgi:hypothetical protein